MSMNCLLHIHNIVTLAILHVDNYCYQEMKVPNFLIWPDQKPGRCAVAVVSAEES